jgi:hypothetical protein
MAGTSTATDARSALTADAADPERMRAVITAANERFGEIGVFGERHRRIGRPRLHSHARASRLTSRNTKPGSADAPPGVAACPVALRFSD